MIVPVLKKYTSDPDYMIWGYEEDDRIVGFITVSLRQALLYEGKVAIIEDLVVEESHHSGGVCRKLDRFVEDIVESMGVKGIEANSDFQRSEAHDFWEKCGYSKLAYQFRKGIH
ncbi:MAG: GNAT family N-acetyltransferase [Candidatus Zixiibacteriota bacterium]|nr:MAG: GNAT family N-acetyltransferase [candidate division Zixibacteria bacterium]